MKYKIEDCIYYIDANNRVVFAEIYKVYDEINAYGTIDLKQFRYGTIHHDNCFEEEKHAKAVIKQRKQRGNKDVNKKRNKKAN